MVIRDFHVVSAVGRPLKTDAVLLVDPDTVLPLPVTLQGFEMVAWGNPQMVQLGDSIDLGESPSSHVPQVPAGAPSLPSCCDFR